MPQLSKVECFFSFRVWSPTCTGSAALCLSLILSMLTISVHIYCGIEIVFMNWKTEPNIPVPMLDEQLHSSSWLEASAKVFSQILKYFQVCWMYWRNTFFVGKSVIFWFSFLCSSFPSLNLKQGKRKQEIKIHRRKNAILILEKKVKSTKSVKILIKKSIKIFNVKFSPAATLQ